MSGWRFVSDFGDTAVTVPLAVLMVVFLVAAKQPRLAAWWAVAILGCAAAIGALKLLLFDCGLPLGLAGLSSPSGHAAMSTALYGGFAAVVGPVLRPGRRAPVILGAAALVAAIAASRVILHNHTPAEVVLGLAVGAIALVPIVACCRPRRLPIAGLALASLALALVLHGRRWPAEQAIHTVAWWLDGLRQWCS